MLKEQLTSELAGIILQHVRKPKGRLTEVSDMCRINRREFNRRGLAKMKFRRLTRIFFTLKLVMHDDEYQQMLNELHSVQEAYADIYDELLLTE